MANKKILDLDYYRPKSNLNFIGRKIELARLREIDDLNEAALIVISGRRRIGKTELIEQYYRNRPLLKFEGLQPDVSKPLTFQAELERQISFALERLAKYTKDARILKMRLRSWREFFELLVPYVAKQETILYFEELQWLANYSDQFTSDLKPFWDDIFRHNNNLRLVFSGSAPSFLTQQFLASSALYSRSNYHIGLQPFSFKEVLEYLPRFSLSEAFNTILTLGAIPAYLKLVRQNKGLVDTINKELFNPDGALFSEYDRIFVSSMANNKGYKDIVRVLTAERFLSRTEIGTKLGQSSSGGLSRLLEDLEKCDFIEKYGPLFVSNAQRNMRYAIRDQFLNFYCGHVLAHRTRISGEKGTYNFSSHFDRSSYAQMLGYSFERWCRQHPYLLAKCMRFDQHQFESGAIFHRQLAQGLKAPGFQIDLAYKRADSQLILCEAKYSVPSNPRALAERLRQVGTLLKEIPTLNLKRFTIRTGLVVAEELVSRSDLLQDFDYVVGLRELAENS